MTRRNWERTGHGFSGFDGFAGCCLATCSCGWSSDMESAEEEAFLAYGRHLRAVREPARRPLPAHR
jgi:hypothetical protein